MYSDNGQLVIEPEHLPLAPIEGDSNIRREVEKVKNAVDGVIEEAPFPDKVESLHAIIEEISEEVKGWRNGHKGPYMETLETLKLQVDEIHEEWDTVASTLNTQRDKLETLLESFPGAIETSTVRALSLRVTHLEQLVTELLEESRAKSTARGARIQLNVSLAALGTTVVLWGVWIGIGVLG